MLIGRLVGGKLDEDEGVELGLESGVLLIFIEERVSATD